MPTSDIRADVTPRNYLNSHGLHPTVEEYKQAILDADVGYDEATLDIVTKNDLANICRIHEIDLNGGDDGGDSGDGGGDDGGEGPGDEGGDS